MDPATYASDISFRHLQPLEEANGEVLALAGLSPIAALKRMKSVAAFELDNTVLPHDDGTVRERLADLLMIPRMSTFAIGALLNHCVSQLPDDASYVNVGIWQGFTFLAGAAGNKQVRCVGIDNFSELGGPRDQFLHRFERWQVPGHDFVEADYRDYFANDPAAPIGVYLYDGAHSYEDQLLGLRIAEPFFADECVIVVDDTNLSEPRNATLDFISTSKRHYEIVVDIRTRHTMHPTFWNGVMVLKGSH